MRTWITILLLAGIIAAVALLWGPSRDGGGVANQMEALASADYGLSFNYRTAPDGYSAVTPEQLPEDSVFGRTLMKTDEYEELMNTTEPREGPPSISVYVYRNPMNRSAAAWVEESQYSNYELATGAKESRTIAGVSYVTYPADGLYASDNYVTNQNGYIYHFSVGYIDAEGKMRDDMLVLLESVTYTQPQIPAQTAHNLIRVTSPEPNTTVTSPLTIAGEARGQWYFEATFPIMLVNWDGLIIAEGYATADGDWMTTDFVPFTAELTFDASDEVYDRGALILHKSNASGLPEHDDAIEIPVRFEQ